MPRLRPLLFLPVVGLLIAPLHAQCTYFADKPDAEKAAALLSNSSEILRTCPGCSAPLRLDESQFSAVEDRDSIRYKRQPGLPSRFKVILKSSLAKRFQDALDFGVLYVPAEGHPGTYVNAANLLRCPVSEASYSIHKDGTPGGLAAPTDLPAYADLGGYYNSADDSGAPLATLALQHDFEGDPIYSGWFQLRQTDESKIPLRSVSLKGRSIEIESEQESGVSYSFSGDFLVYGRLAFMDDAQGGAVVLRGKFIKKAKGKPAVSTPIDLYYWQGD